VPLGTDDSFAVLAGSTVTNSGVSAVTGNLGVSPGTSVTGFPPGILTGVQHAGDLAAAQAHTDLVTAYTNAAGRLNGLALPANLGGVTLSPGIYKTQGTPTLAITGNVTLNGLNNPNSVFIFQIATTLTTAVSSTVTLINGANPCNVFWQVGTSATIGGNSTFKGTILAAVSVTVGTGATVTGRTLATGAAVTLDTNTMTNTP
jgi:hypothetical protein